MVESNTHLVALVGAGPAGLFAAKKIADAGHRVFVLNRDVKPGGLAEYGIFPTKHAMKEGLRKQFRKVLESPTLAYFGNLRVAEGGDLTLEELRAMGFTAIVVAAGAQGTKSLGLPGEEGEGVFHAKDLVYHYNDLPPFSERPFAIGRRCAVVGIGNVMIDVANYLVHFRRVDEMVAVARRGPAERAYDRREMKHVCANLDRAAVRAEMDRIAERLRAVGQDPEALLAQILEDTPEGIEPEGPTRIRFRFLASPKRVLRDASGRVTGLEVEENVLVAKGDSTAAKGTGRIEVVAVDTVIFAIGDRVDASLGLPAGDGTFRTNPVPRGGDPEPSLYEVFDPGTGRVLEGHFVVGWSRKASDGLVGKARQDGENGAKVVLAYLSRRPGMEADRSAEGAAEVARRLRARFPRSVTKEEVALLEAEEREEAARRRLPFFKWPRNEEMLAAIERRRGASATAAAR
ncbi:MAG TPA: FAD-dependent oxidoreductase [Planctomycetota bacterium]|jgi:ferredoxin--NADP+ reductase|nr:FAD-dependent oxidoreductase [Planctomycetota bacterium]